MHSHSRAMCGCFCVTITEQSVCDRAHTAHKAQNIYYLVLYGKSWLIPGVNQGKKKEEIK